MQDLHWLLHHSKLAPWSCTQNRRNKNRQPVKTELLLTKKGSEYTGVRKEMNNSEKKNELSTWCKKRVFTF